MSVVYCQECGFQNPESANYCTRCGALLTKGEPSETTQALSPDEVGDLAHDEMGGIEGPALVVRAGGGRAGETFRPAEGGRTRIGRSPDCEIFLDDVTVSRNHALLHEQDGVYTVEDQGSLNGTFVNRKRIDSAKLGNGDELQIGKYRMTFIA